VAGVDRRGDGARCAAVADPDDFDAVDELVVERVALAAGIARVRPV
jgi:hypothetical protein